MGLGYSGFQKFLAKTKVLFSGLLLFTVMQSTNALAGEPLGTTVNDPIKENSDWNNSGGTYEGTDTEADWEASEDYQNGLADNDDDDDSGFDMDEWNKTNGGDEDDNKPGSSYSGPTPTEKGNKKHVDPVTTFGLVIATPTDVAEESNAVIDAGPGIGSPVSGDIPNPDTENGDDGPSLASVAKSISDFVGDTFDDLKQSGVASGFVNAVENIVEPLAEMTQSYATHVAEDWNRSHIGQAMKVASQSVANMDTSDIPDDQLNYEMTKKWKEEIESYRDSFNLEFEELPIASGYFEDIFRNSGRPASTVSELDYTNPAVDSPMADLLEELDQGYTGSDSELNIDIYNPQGYTPGLGFSTPLPQDLAGYGVSPTAVSGQKWSISVHGPRDDILDAFEGTVYPNRPSFGGANLGINQPELGLGMSPGGVTFIPDQTTTSLDQDRIREIGIEEYHHAGVRATGHFSQAGMDLNNRGQMDFTDQQVEVMNQVSELYEAMKAVDYIDAQGQVIPDKYVTHPMEAAAHTVAMPEHKHVEYVQELTGLPYDDALGLTRQVRDLGTQVNQVYDDFHNHFTDAELAQIERTHANNH